MMADIRTRVAIVAAVTTVVLLSIVSALSFVALVDATRASQRNVLHQRLDNLERRLALDDEAVTTGDRNLLIVPAGEAVPATRPGTLQVVRASADPEIEAFVGRVSTIQIDRVFATIRIGLWVSVLLVGLLVGAMAWMVVDRSLSPVRRLTRQARAIEANESTELLPETGSDDEIGELATTLNMMLRKLRASDADRRRFVSDASHELRTPLMVLTADAEYALEHAADREALARSVLTQSERLTTLVDDMVTLASIDERPAPPDRRMTVGQVLAAAGTDIGGDGLEPAVSSESIPDVSRAVSNIVANAQRHATGTVAVAATRAADSVVITVDDDGPGVPVEERLLIFKRFYRPDGSRARPGGGAGLGLAIARAEVNRVGGTIAVDDGPLGGARFTLTIPLGT